jgi:hypothetical protein
MLVELWIRKFLECSFRGVIVTLTFCRHIGFEELSMKNIDAMLKGKPPLTPVNLHLIVDFAKTTRSKL